MTTGQNPQCRACGLMNPSKQHDCVGDPNHDWSAAQWKARAEKAESELIALANDIGLKRRAIEEETIAKVVAYLRSRSKGHCYNLRIEDESTPAECIRDIADELEQGEWREEKGDG